MPHLCDATARTYLHSSYFPSVFFFLQYVAVRKIIVSFILLSRERCQIRAFSNCGRGWHAVHFHGIMEIANLTIIWQASLWFCSNDAGSHYSGQVLIRLLLSYSYLTTHSWPVSHRFV